MSEEIYVEPMVADIRGNIYYAANFVNEIQQENAQLKEERKAMAKDNALKRKQRDLCKSVLKEIREFMEVEEEAGTLWTVRSTNVILELIDKGIKENE